MRLMLDTNIILDILLKREPFFTDSYNAILNMEENGDLGILSVSAVTDLFYILRKVIGADSARDAILRLQELVTFADVLASDMDTALASPISDLEDALVATVAKRYQCDYILTRNTQDFGDSSVPALPPAEWLQIIGINV